jgi:hypothetical protein
MPTLEVAPASRCDLPDSVVEGAIAVCYRGAILRPGVVHPQRHGDLAGVVKLADTQDLGSCGLRPVGVQVPPPAPCPGQ